MLFWPYGTGLPLFPLFVPPPRLASPSGLDVVASHADGRPLRHGLHLPPAHLHARAGAPDLRCPGRTLTRACARFSAVRRHLSENKCLLFFVERHLFPNTRCLSCIYIHHLYARSYAVTRLRGYIWKRKEELHLYINYIYN